MDILDTQIDYNEDRDNDDMLEDEDYVMPKKKKKQVKAKGVRRQKGNLFSHYIISIIYYCELLFISYTLNKVNNT